MLDHLTSLFVKKEEEEENLLKVLCGDDAELYGFLGHNLLMNPIEGISEKDLDILTEEAEKSGKYRPALDKALEIDPAYQPAIINRKRVESLKNGETLENIRMDSVEYYKDLFTRKNL